MRLTAIFSALKSDVQTLKEANPQLSILVSLGGDTVTGDVFRSIVSRKDQLSNFTESLNSLYQDEVIQVSCSINHTGLTQIQLPLCVHLFIS